MNRYNWARGPFSGFGLFVAAAALIADQAHKYWMLYVFDIGSRIPVGERSPRVPVTSFMDLVLVWNPGISYGLFPQSSETGKLVLIVLSITASVALSLWLAHLVTRFTAASVGLIIGGAIGNTIDRILYGAVADFISLHAGGFNWYVFNIADVAIVAGVVGLIIDSLFLGHKTVVKSQ
ncbi:MAG: signal peptidase II [Hyphomicrobiales bacterium]|nr:signal peptidase II [Hyphomicrobiales bacterium]